jgi:site-specific DNA-methyltransferase (adenine-specific)
MENMLEIEVKEISYLRPDPNNARKHDAKNIDAIAKSLARFGQRKPIVIRGDGTIVAGNGTVEAAKQLGWTEIACARVPWKWTADEVKAYALADNRTAELAEWDSTILAEQLLELDAVGWDVSDLGFEALEPPMSPDDGDESPLEFRPDPITKLGDVYRMGDHLLICGDSTHESTYTRLFESDVDKHKVVDLVWTDPPYGVSYVGKTKDALTIQNDSLDFNELIAFLKSAFENAKRVTKPGACWYVASPTMPQFFLPFATALSDLEVWRHTLIWVKDIFTLGRSDYHYRHEAILYGWTPGAAHQEPPDRKQDTVWEIPRPKRSEEHPTMKPLELIIRAIRNSTDKGQVVLDPFGGSGSTLIAAEQTGRKARLIELDPKYCDVIVTRWQNLTGETAELIKG